MFAKIFCDIINEYYFKFLNMAEKTSLNLFLSVLVGLIFAGVFCAGVYVLAANPWPYNAPAPTDPGCSPTDPTCTVKAPLTDGFTADFSGAGNFTTTQIITANTLKVGSAFFANQETKFNTTGDLTLGVNNGNSSLFINDGSGINYISPDTLNGGLLLGAQGGVDPIGLGTGGQPWINMPNYSGSIAGIGTGGPGTNPWIAYAGGNGYWFSNSLEGDVAYRNQLGSRILIGIDNGAGTATPAMTVKGDGIDYFGNQIKIDNIGNVTALGVGSFNYVIAGTGGFDLAQEGYSLSTSAIGDPAGYLISRGDDGAGGSTSYASFDLINGANTSSGWSMQMQPDDNNFYIVDRATGTNVIGITQGTDLTSFAGGKVTIDSSGNINIPTGANFEINGTPIGGGGSGGGATWGSIGGSIYDQSDLSNFVYGIVYSATSGYQYYSNVLNNISNLSNSVGVLTNDGYGNLSWAPASSGGGGSINGVLNMGSNTTGDSGYQWVSNGSASYWPNEALELYSLDGQGGNSTPIITIGLNGEYAFGGSQAFFSFADRSNYTDPTSNLGFYSVNHVMNFYNNKDGGYNYTSISPLGRMAVAHSGYGTYNETNIPAALYIQPYDADIPGLIVEAKSGGSSDLLQLQSSSGSVLTKIDSTGKITAPNIKFTGLSTSTGTQIGVDSNGNLVKMNSSLRYKENVQPLTDDFSKILQIQPKSYDYKDSGAKDVGYIAEDFDALGLKDLVVYDDQNRPDAIKYDRISIYLTEIIKQQQLDINNLKQKLGLSVSDTIITPAGTTGNGDVTGISPSSITDSLKSLGIEIADKTVNMFSLVVDNFSAKTAHIQNIEMVASNGDIYCTWIDANGDWQKIKGDCATVGPNILNTVVSSTSITSPNTLSHVDQSATDAAQQAAINAAQAAAANAQRIAQQAQQTAQSAQQIAKQAQQQAQTQSQPLDIISIASIADINVAYGTIASAISLPTTANVTLSDNTNQTVLVAWDNGTPTYNSNTPGTYVFSGTLGFSGNVTNTNNLKSTVNVIVGAEPALTPADAAGEAIQNASGSLLNGVKGFINWMFGTTRDGKDASASLINKLY